MKNETVLFETITPYHQPVIFADLLNDIEAVIKRHGPGKHRTDLDLPEMLSPKSLAINNVAGAALDVAPCVKP